MSWILLEACVALVVAVAIVWWTTGARRKPKDSANRKPGGGEGQ